MVKKFFDPVIIPSVWQLEGKESYLEWKREQDEKVVGCNLIETLLLYSIIVGICIVYLLMLVI